MYSIAFDELATIVYVLVDDGSQAHGVPLRKGKAGRKPTFSDSEVLTLLLLMDFLPFPSEEQFVGFLRANSLPLFPKLVDQSQFNRRTRGLRLMLEALRRHWAEQLGLTTHRAYLLDTKPVPVVGDKRSKRYSEFAGSAAYSYCASRQLHDFVYKVVFRFGPFDAVPDGAQLAALGFLHEFLFLLGTQPTFSTYADTTGTRLD